MDIRITQDITFPTDPKSKSPSDYTTFEKGFEATVNEFCYGAAVLQSGDGGVYLVPSSRFEFIQKSKERTYTEAEMKAIRTGWEEKWILQQNRLDQAESSKSYWEVQTKRERENGYTQKRKLDLLEPEIKRIEAAVNRVISEDKEGFLADHVEAIVEELLSIKEWHKEEDRALNDTSWHEAYQKEVESIQFASTEDNHPEDQYAEQNAQELRDQIVKEAKAYVNDIADSVTFGAKVTYILKKYRVTCVIDHGKNFGNSRFLVGRADCNPDDCFNIHIGRAIALKRAKGEEVPEYFLEAPNPETPQVGDINFYDEQATKIVNGTVSTGKSHIASLAVRLGKIIDDSREES